MSVYPNALLLKTFQSMQLEEVDFFNRNCASSASAHGTKYLQDKLMNLLTRLTLQTLPQIQDKIRLKVRKCQQTLKRLTEPIYDDRKELIRVINLFSESYNDSIDGNYAKIGEQDIIGGARICYIFHNTFLNHLEALDPLSGLNKRTILTAVRNSTVIPKFIK